MANAVHDRPRRDLSSAKFARIAVSERSLLDRFVRDLEKGWQQFLRASAREFNYESGRTDLLVLQHDGELLAFEAKLRDWRKALHQAWRNTSYAQRAYVVMPSARAAPALANLHEFEALGVGLCVVDEQGNIETKLYSKLFDPVLPWLREKARTALEQQCDQRPRSRRGSRTADLQREAVPA